jgi:hypothetical protein
MPEPEKDLNEELQALLDQEYRPDHAPDGNTHVSLESAGDAEGMSHQRKVGHRTGEHHPTVLPLVEPLSHEGLTLAQIDKQLRMRHVLDYMRYEDVEVLVDRYVTRLTQQEIADKRGVTQQAVLKRLRTAAANFRVAFAEHWNDALDTRFLTRLGHTLDIEFDPLPGQEDDD